MLNFVFVRFDKTLETIVPLLEPLSRDNEPVVKQHLVEQLRIFAKVNSLNDILISSKQFIFRNSFAVKLVVTLVTRFCWTLFYQLLHVF